MPVEEPAVVSVPVLMLEASLAAVGRFSGVDLSAVRFPAVSTAMDGLLPGREQLSTGGTCWDSIVRSLV